MKLVYLSNIFNHHQKPLADNLYNLLGDGNYYFVETQEMKEEQKNLGYIQYDQPYIIKLDNKTHNNIMQMISEFDVVICGEAPLSLVKERYKRKLLTFRDDESRYKSIIRYLKWPIYTISSLTYNKGYLLSASAFGPIDYFLSGMKKNKIFRWGYFPEVCHYNIEDVFNKKRKNGLKQQVDVSILWVGRLLGLKHPESTIYLARALKSSGISYQIKIVGAGKKQKSIESLIYKYQLYNDIILEGAVPSDRVREYMLKSDVAIITSDRREGWGAVVNETMNSACAVVACENIGAVPYLITNHVNGLTFMDCDWKKMTEHVLWLIEHPDKRMEMGRNAYDTMINTWNAEIASKNLLLLIESLQNGKLFELKEGPCSHAPVFFRKSKFGFRFL